MKLSKSLVLSMTVMLLTVLALSCFNYAYAETDKSYYGDVDSDGKILMSDAVVLQKKVVRLVTLSPDKTLRGDVNADGIISMKDVIYIQRYVAKLINVFPADSQWSFEIDSDGYIDGFF